MKALVKNAADEEQVKEATEKERQGRQRDLDDVAFILSSHKGRRFYWRVLQLCRVFEISFVRDPYQTAFNEGNRNIGNQLMIDAIETDQEMYLQMTQEAKGENR